MQWKQNLQTLFALAAIFVSRMPARLKDTKESFVSKRRERTAEGTTSVGHQPMDQGRKGTFRVDGRNSNNLQMEISGPADPTLLPGVPSYMTITDKG